MKFENVSVIKKANVYFDGKVSSRTIEFSDGSKKTLGFMQAGEYEFDTTTQEIMEVLNGSMAVALPGKAEFKTYNKGESFMVAANSKFQVKVVTFADYCCSYR